MWIYDGMAQAHILQHYVRAILHNFVNMNGVLKKTECCCMNLTVELPINLVLVVTAIL